jgi:hypothetical protein
MKRIVLVMAVLVLIAGAVAAQNTDHRVFGLELGVIGGYDVGAEEPLSGRVFSFVIPVNDSLQFGVAAIDATISTAPPTGNAYVMMTAEYFITPELGVQLLSGSGPQEIGGGLNVFFNILKNQPEDSLSSSLRAQAGYLFDTTDGVDNGSINLGLVASVGL